MKETKKTNDAFKDPPAESGQTLRVNRVTVERQNIHLKKNNTVNTFTVLEDEMKWFLLRKLFKSFVNSALLPPEAIIR